MEKQLCHISKDFSCIVDINKNPAVQIFYFFLMTIGYYFYYYHGLTPLVPNSYVSKYHKILIHFAFCAWMIIFVIASRAHPGKITNDNNKMYLDRYPWDGIIYKKDDTWKFWKMPKIPRSKHWRLCNVWVPRFDHHWIWVNNDIGEGNYKYFYTFLVWHMVYWTYGFLLGLSTLYSVIVDKRLLSAVFSKYWNWWKDSCYMVNNI